MSFWKRKEPEVEPSVGEIEEAKRFPEGRVYRIAQGLDPNGAVPPEAVMGAWKVDSSGEITGEFVRNPNYNPKQFP